MSQPNAWKAESFAFYHEIILATNCLIFKIENILDLNVCVQCCCCHLESLNSTCHFLVQNSKH